MSSSWNGISGDWSNGADWSAGEPGAGEYAYFSGSTAFAVTFSTGLDNVAGIEGYASQGSFVLSGGTLETGSWYWEGAFSQTGGTLAITQASPVWSAGGVSLSGGVLALTQGGVFYEGLDQSGGIIEIASGTLTPAGTLTTLAGTLSGQGALGIGSSDSVTLGAAVVLDVAHIFAGTSGTLALSAGAGTYSYDGNLTVAPSGTLQSAGQTLLLGPQGSGDFAGNFTGGGTLEVQGAYDLGGLTLSGTGATVFVEDTAIQDTSPITLGMAAADSATLVVEQGAIFANIANGALNGNSLSSFVNLGTYAVTAPVSGGSALINVENATLAAGAALEVAAYGQLDIQGATTKASALLLGSIGGAGTLQIGGDETASLGGISLTIANLEIGSYYAQPGELLLTAGQDYEGTLVTGDGTIDTNGFGFTLGSASRGTLNNVISGGGTLLLAGDLQLDGPTLTGSGTSLLLTGMAEAASPLVYLGTGTSFGIASGGTLDFANGNGIYATGPALVDNAGLIEVTDGPPYGGPAISNATFVNSGTLALENGVLQLSGGVATLGGLIEGPGTLLFTSDTITLDSSLRMDQGGLAFNAAHITLAGNVSLSSALLGGSMSINTEGYNLTLVTGPMDAVVTGGGTIVTQGVVDTGPSGIWLEGQGTALLDQYVDIEDTGALVLGEAASDSPTLSIAADAQYILEGDGGIVSGQGTTGVVLNKGLLLDSSLYPQGPATEIGIGTFVNIGTLNDASGVLELDTSLVNDGFITIAQNMEIVGDVTADAGQSGTFAIGAGATLGFSGAFLTNPVAGSLVAASQIISFTGADGRLDLTAPQSFSGTIDGFAAGDIIDISAYSPSPGGPNELSYANNELTLYSVYATEITPDVVFNTVALETLAITGINPADLQIIADNGATGGYDLELSNTPTGSAPAQYNYPPIYGATWLGPDGADWGTAADWATQYSLAGAETNPNIEAAVPPEDYDITLTNSLSLTYSTASTGGSYVANILQTGQGTTLDITGGTLAAAYGIEAEGAVTITGGTLEQISGYDVLAVIGTLNLAAGGALRVDDGTLGIGVINNSSNIIAGTLEGAGEALLQQASFVLESSALLSIATLGLDGARLTLAGNASFGGQVLDDLGGNINLNGNGFLIPTLSSLIMAANATVSGGGTLTVAGEAYLGGLITGAGTELLITGTAQTGYSAAELGTLSALSDEDTAIVVAQSGTFYNPSFIEPTGAWSGTLINNGYIAQLTTITPYDEAGQQEQLALFVNNADAVLEVAAGTMDFYLGAATLSGDIAGNGTLEFSSETVSLLAGLYLGVENLSLTGAVLSLETSQNYANNFVFDYGTIQTNGFTLALGGGDTPDTGALTGTVTGGGALQLGGDYFANDLVIGGTGTQLDEYGLLNVGNGGLYDGFGTGDTPTIAIEAGGIINFAAAGDYYLGQGSFTNAGLLEDSATGNVLWTLGSFNSNGAIQVNYGELGINASFGTLEGLVSGAGTLQLESYKALTLASGLSLAVGTLSLFSGLFDIAAPLTYNGAFLSGSSATINLAGGGLTLEGGGTLGGTLTGIGGLTISGDMLANPIYLWSAGTTLDIAGTLVETTSGLYAGSTNATGPGAVLAIGNTGVLDIASDQFIGATGSFDNLTINNAGLIEKTGGIGTTTIAASSFINTGTIAALDGSIAIAGVLVNDGVLFEDAFGAISAATISGTGSIIIDPAATTISGAVGAGQSVSFTGPGGSLVLQDAAQFAGTIAGFGPGDIIDLSTLASSAVTGVSYANGALTITETSGSLSLAFAGLENGTSFTYNTDGAAGTYIEENALCFCAGTRILTPGGEAPVETLRIGDEVVTRFGGVQTIKWIGRQNYAPRFISRNHAKIPVRIAAGALGEGLPQRDLAISPGHSVLLHDTLLLGFALVNGVTITQPVPDAEVAYYQLDLLTHDCVMAEGVWAESYADAPGLRGQFHNAAEFAALYPAYETPSALQLCAPRPERGADLAAALRPVAALAASAVTPGALEGYLDMVTPSLICGWAQDKAHPQLPVALEILCHGEVIGKILACDYRDDLATAGFGLGRCAFTFTPPIMLDAAARAGISIRAFLHGGTLPRSLAAA